MRCRDRGTLELLAGAGAGRETSVSYDYAEEINVEISNTPGYIYELVPVMQKARVRLKTWRVFSQELLILQFSDWGYIAGIKCILYRKCIDPESVGLEN